MGRRFRRRSSQDGSSVLRRPISGRHGIAANCGPTRREKTTTFSRLSSCFWPPNLIVYKRTHRHRDETRAVGGSASVQEPPTARFFIPTTNPPSDIQSSFILPKPATTGHHRPQRPQLRTKRPGLWTKLKPPFAPLPWTIPRDFPSRRKP